MKQRKKALKQFIAGLSAICMVLIMVPVLTAEAASLRDSARETICELVGNYMESRETAIMTGDMEKLEKVAVIGIVNDEDAHRVVLSERDINISGISYQIAEVDIRDTMSFVTLNERIEYATEDITASEEVKHSLTIMRDEEGTAKVVSDSYTETVSCFSSCSYVFEGDKTSILQPQTADLRSELVCWAEGEVGYLEKKTNENLDDFAANAGSGNYTKYGEWYGTNGQPWCAIFVSWCAHRAGVSTSVIPKYSVCTTGMDYFKDANCFYYSSAYNGNYIPRIGDIFFTGSSKTSSSHTGIVVAVSSTQITVVDGNYSDKVSRHTYSLTDSGLIGFASPNY